MGEEALKVLGAVTEAKRFADSSMALRVLGIPVAVSRSTYNRASALTRRPDERRREEQFTFNLFDRPVRVGGEFESTWRYRNVNRFRYYGELLRPELSNLQIWTDAFGWRFWRSSSVEFLYHHYRQIQAAAFIRDTSLKAEPLGRRRSIGNEWDLWSSTCALGSMSISN